MGRISSVDPHFQDVVVVTNTVELHAVTLHGALFVGHQFQTQPGLVDKPLRHADPRLLVGAENALFVLLQWRQVHAAVDLLVVEFDNLHHEPGLELGKRQSRLLLGSIRAALLGVGERRAGQGMNGVVQRATKAFDITTVVRSGDRSPMQVDPEVLAGPGKHAAPELFGIVSVHRGRFTPHRPGRGDVVLGEPGFLGQHGVRQT